jgi:hypothetical protein
MRVRAIKQTSNEICARSLGLEALRQGQGNKIWINVAIVAFGKIAAECVRGRYHVERGTDKQCGRNFNCGRNAEGIAPAVFEQIRALKHLPTIDERLDILSIAVTHQVMVESQSADIGKQNSLLGIKARGEGQKPITNAA